MRQPCSRSARPKATRPRSWRSPAGHASTARRPVPTSQPRARARRRPPIRFDAKCSRAISPSPSRHRSPITDSTGSTTSTITDSCRPGREQLVEEVLSRGCVEPVEGPREALQRVSGCRHHAHGPRGLGRGHALGETRAHRPDALLVLGRVEAVPRRSARRFEQPVAVLPRAQQLRAGAGSAREFADPQSLEGHVYASVSASWSRAARPRLLTVPVGTPVSSAISR